MRIDLYAIDIGGGHLAPAWALKRQFDLAGYPDVEVRVVNLGRELRTRLLSLIYKTYWNGALRYPPLINAFYRGADNPFLMKAIDRIVGIAYLPRFVGYLERQKPDLVVSTYFTFTHYLELLKRVGQLDAAMVVLNPEPFDAHSVWFSRAADWSLVFSEQSRREIIAKGIRARTVKLFPFPINPGFSRRTAPKARLRRRLGLEERPFTLLLFFGAEGRGPAKRYLAELVARRLEVQVVVICGRNQRLAAQLADEARTLRGGPTRLAVRGFVTDVPDYIAAADLVVGKSGPNQVFETLLQERPLVISSFLANEARTTEWVVSHGVGWLCRTPDRFVALVERLLAQPALLEQCRRSIRGLGLKSGAPEICEFLYQEARRRAAAGRRVRVIDRLRRAAKGLEEAARARRDARRNSPVHHRAAGRRPTSRRST
jgi:processive 1,2-diacylglycerol beta-glucosyltransferase